MADIAVGSTSRARVREAAHGSTDSTRMVKMTLAIGVLILAGLVALTLTRSPPRVLGGSTADANTLLTYSTGDATICQAGETLPAGTTAVRMSILAYVGAKVHVAASVGRRVLTEGSRDADWSGRTVTVPVRPLQQTASNVTLCAAIGPNSQPIYILGAAPSSQPAETPGGAPLSGSLRVEYLASGEGSWWSRVSTVTEHMELGRYLTGAWLVLLIGALVAAVAVLALWLPLRESRSAEARSHRRSPTVAARRRRWGSGLTRRLRSLPTAAWVCVAIAFLNVCAWSLIVPPFEGKDEADHFAYVVDLVENHVLPANGQPNGVYSPQETLVLEGLHYPEMVHAPQTPAISSTAEQEILDRDVNAHAPTKGSGEAGIATSEPPLYYAIQAIPYLLVGEDILAQLQLMRLVGALFGAITALCTFLFLREILPRMPWAATVGAVCVALQPQFAFMSGSVNPDSMLVAVAAVVFLLLARAFRRGLSRRLAVALGAVIAVGFVTKLNFVGFAFGVYAGLLVLAVRAFRSGGRGALVAPLMAAGIGALPVALDAVHNLLAGRAPIGAISANSGLFDLGSLGNAISYIWEMYLPRVPGMPNYFRGLLPIKDVWFDRSVGFYGWMDVLFAPWVAEVALVPATIVAVLFARGVFKGRAGLRGRLGELGTYAAIVLGVLVMIAASSYLSVVLNGDIAFGEPRYLLPLIPLLGAAVALAIRGSGPRWAPAVGAALVILFLGHDIFSQLQVIARYYG